MAWSLLENDCIGFVYNAVDGDFSSVPNLTLQ